MSGFNHPVNVLRLVIWDWDTKIKWSYKMRIKSWMKGTWNKLYRLYVRYAINANYEEAVLAIIYLSFFSFFCSGWLLFNHVAINWYCIKSIKFVQRTVKFRNPRLCKFAYTRISISDTTCTWRVLKLVSLYKCLLKLCAV